MRKTLPTLLLQAEKLPSLPGVAVEVLRLTKDEDSTLEELVEVIARDPVLATKLLKLSNSSLFNLGGEVTTLQRAAIILGMKTVQMMSLSFTLVDVLPKSGEGLDYAQYWRRSLIHAVTGRDLAKAIASSLRDEGFMCGLLSQIGHLVMSECLPDRYAAVLAATEGHWPSLAIQEEILGFHHGDVGGILLSAWQLPQQLAYGIQYMETPDELPEDAGKESRTLVELMNATSQIANLLCEDSNEEMLANLYDLTQGQLEMDIDTVTDLLIELEADIKETAKLLNIHLPEGTSLNEIIEQSRMQMVNISLNTAADLQHVSRHASELEDANRELASQAYTDALTGLPNRAAFEETFHREIRNRIEHRPPKALGLLMIDIDHFKDFNDSYGHPCGDAVLRHVGEVLRCNTRDSDLSTRYGGEEFALIVPRTSPPDLAVFAERVRKAIEERKIEFGAEHHSVTVSIGGACLEWATSTDAAKLLLQLADHHLYTAKESGRNRCEIATEILKPNP